MSGVEQQDREAAARHMRNIGSQEEYCAPIAQGRYDDSQLVQAFSRHRHEARKAALEEAAGIAEDHALRAWEIGEAEGQNAICSSGRNHGARAIATAIRSAVGGE